MAAKSESFVNNILGCMMEDSPGKTYTMARNLIKEKSLKNINPRRSNTKQAVLRKN